MALLLMLALVAALAVAVVLCAPSETLPQVRAERARHGAWKRDIRSTVRKD